MITKNLILNRKKQKPILWDAFFNPSKTPKPLVVFCHGYKGFKDWGSWDVVAEAFKKQKLLFCKI